MIISATSFQTFFPEFSGVDSARIDVFLDNAKLRVSEKVFNTTYGLAVFFLAAHMLSSSINNTASGGAGTGNKGGVSSEKVGDLAISYGSSSSAGGGSGSSAQLTETSYGREYIQLRKEKTMSLTIGNVGASL